MRKLPILPKFACFGCRKVFRKPYLPDDESPLCPDCGEPMTNMGRHFKPPERSDIQQWDKARQLRQNGIIFNGHTGRLPKRRNQVKAYLADRDRRREKSEGERLLERFPKAQKPR